MTSCMTFGICRRGRAVATVSRMKTLPLALVSLLLSTTPVLASPELPAAAEERALDHGGFGGPSLGAGQLLDGVVPLVGGRGGWIVDHRFVLGAALYALPRVGSWPTVEDADGNRERRGFWHGGLWLEYLLPARDRLHFSVGTMLGASYLERSDSQPGLLGVSAEPTATAGITFTRFFRADLAVGYRVTPTLPELHGLTTSLLLRFGSF